MLFYVPKRVIDDALDYVRRSQNSDGSVRYRLFGNEQSSFELTAAACSTLAYGGAYQDASVRRARDWLWGAHFDGFQAAESTFPYYGNFYAVQTLWFDYDYDRMARYYPRIVDWFESRFDPEAHVYRAEAMQIHKESLYGELYRLAFATLTLLVPFEQLPIFQR